ncbi:MAG: EVE domain-containing protein [Pseudobdellovibrionaceae bacterium]
MKSEPEVYGIDDLQKDKTTWWEGVRNYQARNFMSQQMQVGDEVLFYHSNAEPSGLAGLAEVSETAKPDKTAFDKKSEYYDAKSTLEKPIWFCVQVKFKKKFKSVVPLSDLKADSALQDLLVIKKGQRLSVQPVSEKDFLYILKKWG